MKDRGASFFCLVTIVGLSISFGVHSFQVGAPQTSSRITRTRTRLCIQIRDWQEQDIEQIKLLLFASVASDFDPEGPLSVDCGSAVTIPESYNDGCFLVATNDNDSEILGTAALIVGTQISYLKSGASISTPTVTGAVRRVCAANHDYDSEPILRSLLKEIEARANKLEADELIMLVYPSKRRPTSELVERLGYRELPTRLSGLDALQYSKALGATKSSSSKTDTTSITAKSDRRNNPLGDVVIGGLLATLLLVGFGIVNFMGFEVLPSVNDNRGVGIPLSIEEVLRLKEDEKLKRSSLDGQLTTRQWEDLEDEERREEAALMKIIQGQDVRIRPSR